MRRLLFTLVLFLSTLAGTCCKASYATMPSLEMEVSDQVWAAHWKEMVPRLDEWLDSQSLAPREVPDWAKAKQVVTVYYAENLPSGPADWTGWQSRKRRMAVHAAALHYRPEDLP